MKSKGWKSILLFILGMLTFAVGWFILSTFIFVERPSPQGIVEDWGQICFWAHEGDMYATVSPKGCYSPTCTRPTLQEGTAILDKQDYRIEIETRFVIAETSRFPLPCVEDCAGGGQINLNLGALIPNEYEIRFRGEKVGEMNVYSGRPTPRQCFENPAE
jgi:hypothetical protein